LNRHDPEEREELNRHDLEEREELNRQDAKFAKEEEERGRGESEKSRVEPERGLDELAHRVIGAAIEVHRHLGPGFLEGVYEDALAVKFQLREIFHERQKTVAVVYKGKSVGEGRLDFLVGGCLIVELKAVDGLASIHKAQVLSYLRATRLQLGLLINFNVPTLRDGLQRVIHS
jgi:GxxExxY protein